MRISDWRSDVCSSDLKPALDAWAAGKRVVKLIGFDAGAKDKRRPGISGDDKYEHLFLLRELGLDRQDCARQIQSVGLPIPLKSSCFFCSASNPAELLWLHHHHPDLDRMRTRLNSSQYNAS